MNSVTLDKSKCMGCTTCIKHCPTEAIRVRRGRAHIIAERCIDCGQCIRVCPHHAKKPVCDPFEKIKDYKYSVALPAPSLYGQFRNLNDINVVLQALLDIGFDSVYEVSRAAEMISDLTHKIIDRKKSEVHGPVISSACPTTVRLICMRFPKLIPNIIDLIAPAELAAMHAREDAVASTGLAPSDIGIFFITPCPAKVTAGAEPLFLGESVIDGSISMAEIYKKLLGPMKKVTNPPPLSKSGNTGIGWARAGGESSALLGERHLAVDGIENVIDILEDIENDLLPEVDFLEINACTQGCVGGCLTIENPYSAKSRINMLIKKLPSSINSMSVTDIQVERAIAKRKPEYDPVWQLSGDRQTALQKYSLIQALQEQLPGLDCGSCGAPSCRAFAEDVITGYAKEEDCIFRMRERMLAEGGDAEEFLPPPFRRTSQDKGNDQSL